MAKMKIRDILSLKYGKDQKKALEVKGDNPILGTGGIIGRTGDYLYNKPSVLIGRKGSVENTYYIDVPFWTIDTLFYTEINTNLVIPKWFYYKTKNIRFERLTEGTGVPSLTAYAINNVTLNVPSIEYQQRIVNKISPFDEKIEKNKELISSLEEYSQLLFHKWFVDFNFPNENTQAYKDNGGEMKKVNKKLIPLNWKRGTFKDLMTVKSGKRSNKISEKPTEKDVVPVYGASKIIGYTDETLYDEQVIITGRVGTHGVLMREKDKSWPSDNTLVVFPEFYEFTYQLLKTLNFSNLNIGSTQPLITQSNLLKQKCILPPREVLEKFESVVTPLMRKADLIHEENKKLIEIRDLLIHKLLK